MPDQLLNLLKIFLLLLLYLFFLRVLRAVWAEVNPPRPVEVPAKKARGARPARRAPSRKGNGGLVLRVVLPPNQKGRTYPLGEELTLGRAAGCQITIDDTYASQLHARVFQRDGTVYVEDLGSTNGTYLNRRKVTGPMQLQRGDKLQIGNTVLELGVVTSVRVRVGAVTDVGRVRTINQDAFLIVAEHDLYVVADGMGGHQGGEVASSIAIDALRGSYDNPSADALTDAIAVANARIFEAGEGDPSLRGMGTTVVAAALVPTDGAADAEGPVELLIANVGDSRAYLFRDSQLTQLTEDHSMVADLIREGRLTAEEAEVHPQRNIVTRVLGVYDDVEIDLWPVDPVRGDRYLLCSDGLSTEVSTDQISSVLRRLADPQEAAAELVRLAIDGGGRDNVTVLVLDVIDDGGVAEAASAALAGTPGRTESHDLAGFATALDDTRQPPPPSDDAPASGKKAKAARERRSLRSRLTWRAVLFVVLVVGVIGGAFATIQWYGTSTFYVGFDGDEVAIYQGRPGGVLWIDPSLEEDTGIERGDVPQRYLQDLDKGHEHSSLAEAKRYVSNIERDIIRQTTTTTTTTTTAPTTTAAPPPP